MSRLSTTLLAVLAALALGLSACGNDGAEPAQSDDLTNVTHSLEPTDQMRQAAEQQCKDDPDLDVGYVKAVAPESGNVLAELEVDCDDVR